MQSQDIDVLQHVAQWCADGDYPWLCVIVGTLGSSPRPVGSMLACLDDGRQAGSISGGCVEEDLLERLHAGEFDTENPQLLEFGVTAEENERLGLPCGGKITLLLQRLTAADETWVGRAITAIEQRQCAVRELSLSNGESAVEPVDHFDRLEINDETMRQYFGPRMRMLLVGAGQLAKSLAELALAMDYDVLVTDPRQEVLDQWDGPAVMLVQGMPDDVIRKQGTDRHSVIITLTHDPRIDDMALMEALTGDAFYIGALGSVRTTAKRLKRLPELGLSPQQISRLHAPVGLAIGSKTPIEIAVAIMAELTQLRRSGSRS